MDINTYIRSLSYDPRMILSVVQDGATTTLPMKDRTKQNNAVVICTKTHTSLKKNLSEVAILSPAAGVIYPGALIIADENLMDGHPTPIALARKECTLSIDLPGLKESSGLLTPSGSSTQDFINQKIEAWNKDPKSQGYVNAARSFFNVTQSFTSQQAALDLGFNAKWTSGNASSQLNVASSSERSVVIAYFKQVFYTVTINTPESPASVFADSVTIEDAQNAFSSDSPPAYVRSVDYGRILMVRMETTAVDTSVNLKGAFEQATSGGVTAGGNLKAKYQDIINNSTFTVVAIGGGAESALEVFGGASDGQLKGLNDYIKRDSTYRRDNPGLPIAYQVAFLKDNSFALMGFPTEYTETQCVKYPNGFVKFKHSGWYVAKVQVTWLEPDHFGNYIIKKQWDSGKKTAGWTETVDIPGDAHGLRLKAWADTGLAWDPWGEILNIALEGPDNKCYRLTGQTLNRHYDNNC